MLEKLLAMFDRSERLQAQESEIESLRREIERFRGLNARIESSMRHCLTCEYRDEVNARR